MKCLDDNKYIIHQDKLNAVNNSIRVISIVLDLIACHQDIFNPKQKVQLSVTRLGLSEFKDDFFELVESINENDFEVENINDTNNAECILDHYYNDIVNEKLQKKIQYYLNQEGRL